MSTTIQNTKELQLKSWTGVAPGWKKHDAAFTKTAASVSEKMLDSARVREGMRLLDIATGVGEPALTAARRVGASGSVLATDFVEPMLAFAREKAEAAGLANVEFRCVDGEKLDEPEASFDAATIRWGIMFMPDAVSCLRGARQSLKDGGRIAVGCWAGPEKNLWATLPMGILMRLAELPKPAPGSPGLYAYSDPMRLEGALVEAGFHDVTIEAVDLTMVDYDTFEEYWTWVNELVGPAASIIAKLSEEQKATAISELRAELENISPGGRVVLRGTTWVASGKK